MEVENERMKERQLEIQVTKTDNKQKKQQWLGYGKAERRQSEGRAKAEKGCVYI